MKRSNSRVLSALALGALTLLALTSCWEPQLCLSPLYTEKNLAQDDRILGTWNPQHTPFLFDRTDLWVGDPDEYTVRQSGDGYILTHKPIGREIGTVSRLHLVRLGKYLFVDISDTDGRATSPEAKQIFPAERAHILGKITITRNVIILRMMEVQKADELARAGRLRLKRVARGAGIKRSVVISSTQSLQTAALAHAKDTTLFSRNFELCRKGADCEIEVPREEFREEPTRASAGGRLALAYMRRGRVDDARSTWKHVTPPEGDATGKAVPDFVYRFDLARAFMDWGYFDSGIAILKAQAKALPNDPWGSIWLGLGYLYVNRPKDALQAFRAAVEKGQGEGRAACHALLALAYMQLGEFQRARDELASAPDEPIVGSILTQAAGAYESEYSRGATSNVERMKLADEPSFASRFLDDRKGGASLVDAVASYVDFGWWFSLPSSGQPSVVVRDLSRYAAGQSSDAAFLQQFHFYKGQFIQPEICVGYYLAGEKHLRDGDPNTARTYFQKSVDSYAFGYIEWILANARMKELRQQQ